MAQSELPVVFCDEAGNSGPALLDPNQPVFVLASHNYSEEECDQLLANVRSSQGGEPKFSTLRKSDSGRRRLVAFFEQPALSPDRIVCTLDHKRYVIVAKIVDVLIEYVAYRDGLDLYARGANIAHANVMYHAMPVLFGEKAFGGITQGFVKMIREPTRENIDRFYYWVERAFNGTKRDSRNMLAPILVSRRYIDEILKSNTRGSIDPAVHSFVNHCITWGDNRFKSDFRVVHDRSKPLFASRDILAAFMDASVEPETIGYDRRTFTFPLRARELQFADSHNSVQLQVADLIAGAVMAFGAHRASGTHDDLAPTLGAVGIERFVTDCLWPSLAVTPEELGTEKVGGINMVDHVAAHLTARGVVR
ncbi:DUF3800 domain-containing protein [Ralstonia mojiangensis]|uniref:DUF3800 domain-containing protein n=1 Tax=Ralstonia mojiangensis TaxID=2953895 RepID=UPI002090506C|nr:DUF3800 domain-containing protein [Ralstonia mojiangensis]MCO5411095.1 DUF3800 domain-containing protein [Ralstonia mojiangensis]